MHEKELRLGVVCSGGISLAVYMHGLTKEILKLARASKQYHAVSDQKAKQERSFDVVREAETHAYDTEEIYFQMLQQIGAALDLRVIVDVIAGASAGGINSVMLARALAHDLPYDGLRDMWLDGADVQALVAGGEKPDRFSQRLFRPLVRWVAGDRLSDMTVDEEVSGKLVSMMQIARLRPPFSGPRLVESLIDAMEGMGRPRHPHDSLMPQGHRLDMFVTLTDFFGYAQSIPLYDPPFIEEREHRHLLRFKYRRWPSGELETDFDDASIPALAFAARATSSFPAVFPPAQLSEVDHVLEERGRKWTEKPAFLASNFAIYQKAGSDPEQTSFIDGSVLNNKPFGAAIDAIHNNPAYRKVDRRLVYINPNPAGRPPPPTGKPPGVLRTLKAALSDIPRNEPIYDDLAWVQERNARVKRIRSILEAARPDIVAVVEEVTKGKLERRHITREQVAQWRDLANARASLEAGFASKGHLRFKLDAAVAKAAEIVTELCGATRAGPRSKFINEAIAAWAEQDGALPPTMWVPETGTLLKDPPAWVRLLRAFDLDFRRRRIRFVIRSLNELYGRLSEPVFADLTSYRLDYLKAQLYDVLDTLRARDGTAAISLDAANRARDVFGPVLDEETFEATGGAHFGRTNQDAIGSIIQGLARDLDLEAMNRRADDVFAGMEHAGPGGVVRRELLTDYIGFSFWDIVMLSAGGEHDAGEFDEIRVARVSPQDCNALRQGGPDSVLKGVKLGNFGAFFKRAHRENDYLWGRLHGVDRLIDIVWDAARVEGLGHVVDRAALKKAAFRAILTAERPHLKESRDLIDQLEREVEALGIL